MNEEYKEAFSEVDTIINMMPLTLSNKIPSKLKNIISKEKSTEYIPNISEPIEDCQLKKKTIILLALIYRDFLCSKEEQKRLLEIDQKELEEYEKELREKYNPDNLFKKSKVETQDFENTIITRETAIVEYKEKNFLQKIFDKIKHLFKKN